MSDFDVDLFVIGGGSGGVRAARIAATHGATVMLAEEHRLGGTCVIRGCVPKKLFVYASRYAAMFDDAAAFGWFMPARNFDWPTLIAAKDREITRLEQAYTDAQRIAGVEILKSRAVIEDAHTVRIADKRTVTAKFILVATGARPEIPILEGVEHGITSNEVFDLKTFPARLVIGGAGYIAVEFAALFAALGSQVTVVCRGDNVLRGFDEDLRVALAADMTRRGVTFMFDDRLTTLEPAGAPIGSSPLLGIEQPLHVSTAQGGHLVADQVLFAYGRAPNSAGLGLDKVGVQTDAHGAVIVDANSQTSISSIYAVGDVTNRVNLTPVAIKEGHAFADSVFGNKPWQVHHELIPKAVFTTPEIGTVGMTEAEARFRHDIVDIYMTTFRSLKAVASDSPERTMMKLIADGSSDRLLGVHLFAEDASEMIQLLAVALRAGATVDQFMSTMAVHPTMGEELVTMTGPTIRYDRRPTLPSTPAAVALSPGTL